MTANKGHSGAKISKTKRGVVKCDDPGKGLIEQAALCEDLYPVTPKIIDTHFSCRAEYYTMEELQEPIHAERVITAWAILTLRRMRGLLMDDVWCKPLSCDNTWCVSLLHWLPAFRVEVPRYERLIEELFLRHRVSGYSKIHGDPTLANVLYRGENLVIGDPIPPKGKIPPHLTVDIGKMLQSAIGWETVLLGWEYDTKETIEVVLRGHKFLTQARAWFWASIHCLRLLPYARNNTISNWALAKAAQCVKTAENIVCCMPSTSTVL